LDLLFDPCLFFKNSKYQIPNPKRNPESVICYLGVFVFFVGFVVFYDPPKKGIALVFKQIYDAGIKVKMITGDNSNTAGSIAAQAGIINASAHIEGKELIMLSEEDLDKKVKERTLFARMYPEAK
jgi:Ca2+-transporting ATPase